MKLHPPAIHATFLPYKAPKYSNTTANPIVQKLRPVKLSWTLFQHEGLLWLLSVLDCAKNATTHKGQVLFDASSGESMHSVDMVECTNWSSKGSSEIKLGVGGF